MTENYYTAAAEGQCEQVIDKSRFIAHLAKVKNPADVDRHMREVKRLFPGARHYVYAYRLYENRLEKASDDGEPQGTGGRPVLEQLQCQRIWDVQIVIVRYFGGVLLGTGGLTRAYGGTARLVLEKVGLVELAPYFVYNLELSYSWYEKIKYAARQKGWENGPEVFGEKVSLQLYIPENESEAFEIWLDEISNKQISRQKMHLVMRPKPKT